jgi:hypothetical protein
MRLLAVELSRFSRRRAVVLTLLAGALLAAVVAFSTVYDTRPATAAERADAERQAASVNQQFRQDYETCLDDPGSVVGGSRDQCVLEEADASWFLSRSRLDLAVELDTSGTIVALLMAGVALIVGATFAGVDWATGSVSNQLLFEPRRGRVWTAKAVAVAAGVGAATAVVLACFWATLLVATSMRGIDVPDAVAREAWLLTARGVALAAAAALGSFALTMLFRHTVGTLALLFAYAAVGEGLAASLPVDRISRWALSNNVVAWVQDGRRVFDESVCRPGSGCDPYYQLGLPFAATYLAVLLVLAVVVSVVTFLRRDVP